MDEQRNVLSKVTDYIRSNPKILIIIGLVGIALIFLSSVIPKKQQATAQNADITADQYARLIEQQLSDTVEQIVGGKVKVLVTLSSGVEYVYASEIKEDSDKLEDSAGNEKSKQQQKDSSEKKFVIINDESGKEIPLTITEIMPQIKGVVVVCSGGENEAVSGVVTKAITTALDIPESRVWVTGTLSN
ncbi:MAG: hypothetical protein IJF54_04285 [Clostridia bacterium]|nr:hypothetical protein [Clostridia bacterium]